MNWNRVDLKQKGKAAFQANYWKCVLAALVMALISGNNSNSSSNSFRKSVTETGNFSDFWQNIASNNILLAGIGIALAVGVVVAVIVLALGIAARVFAFNPLEVGCQSFFIENSFNAQAGPKLIASAFKSGYYSNIVTTMFVRDLYIFLWSLLFVIPGIVKAYEFRMIPYLLAENPSMSREEAFLISKQMMDGQKWEAFVLDLSFIGWHLLSAITLGVVGVFYVAPYVHATNAELYLTLKHTYYYTQPQIQYPTY